MGEKALSVDPAVDLVSYNTKVRQDIFNGAKYWHNCPER